ncbi:unannotated protein [freshwater metagenome]|uniref:Unannotated protein n=1 Tax=freshwater metagenome TaxID=449393 RepID=A0A6J6RJ64_9ZZZZ|nr:hypothetical protein [Actinomycetota bacterium]
MALRETFRPKSGLIMSACVLILSLLFIWSAFLTTGTIELATTICWAIAVNAAAYLILVRPKVIFTDEAIILVNPIQEITIGWGDITGVDAKWCMTVDTKAGRFNAWAAPTSSSQRSKKIHVDELKSMAASGQGSIAAAHSPRSDSGIALHMTLIRLNNFTGTSAQFVIRRNFIGVTILSIALILAAGLSAISF